MNLNEVIAFDLEERAKYEALRETEYVYVLLRINNILSGEFVIVPQGAYPSLEEAVLVISSDVRVIIEKRGHLYALCNERGESHWCVFRTSMIRWKK